MNQQEILQQLKIDIELLESVYCIKCGDIITSKELTEKCECSNCLIENE